MEHAPFADRQAGNFGSIAGLAAGRHAIYRSASQRGRRRDAGRHQAGYRRLHSHVRRSAHRTDRLAQQVSQLVGQRIGRHRGRDGDQHSSAQSDEICDAVIAVVDNPDISIDELLEIVPGPDFPTGGIICGRAGIRRGYKTGRSTIMLRAQCKIEEMPGNRSRILVSEIPYQQTRDGVVKKIAELVNGDKIKGISGIRDESDLKEPVRLVIELKRDADPDVVLNQLYQFSPLQTTFSVIFLALVDGKPRELTLKEMLAEFVRHRRQCDSPANAIPYWRAPANASTPSKVCCWRWPTLIKIIQTIRTSRTQAEAKAAADGNRMPRRDDEGGARATKVFSSLSSERGEADVYSLTSVQTDEILRMRLGQLVNLEQEKLAEEHARLCSPRSPTTWISWANQATYRRHHQGGLGRDQATIR